MSKKLWIKSTLLVTAGALLQLGLNSGCLSGIIQRTLVAVLFD